MLAIHHVARLRSLSENGRLAVPTQLEGLRIRSEPISVEGVVAEPVSRGPPFSRDFPGPARIFGQPAEASCLNGIGGPPLELAPREIRRIENARIIGNCAVLAPDGVLYTPSPVTGGTLTASLDANRSDHQGFLLTQCGQSVRASFLGREAPRKHPLNVVFFHNNEPGNYGSFLIRQLPAMLLLRAACANCDAYVTPERTPWFADAIALLGLPSRPVFPVAGVSGDTFDPVTFANEIDNEGFGYGDLGQVMRGCAGLGSGGQGSDRIYVSRSLSSTHRPDYRVLVDEPEIERAVEQRGYRIVYPETLGLADQIRTFAGANRIMGPSGSGMVNACFTRPGARVLDMESFTYTVRQHAKVYASSGASYSFLFGEVEDGDRPLMLRNWSAPKTLLEQGLDWLDAD